VKGATSLTNEEWCLQVDAPISSVYNLSPYCLQRRKQTTTYICGFIHV